MDRLDQEHFLYRKIFGDRNYLSPLKDLSQNQPVATRCLEIGYGTGIWLLVSVFGKLEDVAERRARVGNG